jgi:hypothetical protein
MHTIRYSALPRCNEITFGGSLGTKKYDFKPTCDDGSGKTLGEKKATSKMTDKQIGGNEGAI